MSGKETSNTYQNNLHIVIKQNFTFRRATSKNVQITEEETGGEIGIILSNQNESFEFVILEPSSF